MSSESEVDEFYDAEEGTPVKISRHKSKHGHSKQNTQSQSQPQSSTDTIGPGQATSTPTVAPSTISPIHLIPSCVRTDSSEDNSDSTPQISDEQKMEVEKKAIELEKRKKKLEELRRKMQNEEDDSVDVSSACCSQASSIEGVYVNRSPSIPRGTGEDQQSVVSLGKVGLILNGAENLSVDSVVSGGRITLQHERQEIEVSGPEGDNCSITVPQLQEPDLVASTKTDRATESLGPPPVAPPRRKRKKKLDIIPAITTTYQDSDSGEPMLPMGIPSPSTAVDSLTKEFEHSLDLKSAIKGLYVVKPQDEEMARAEGPPPETLPEIMRDVGEGSMGRVSSSQQGSLGRGPAIPPMNQPGSLGRAINLQGSLGRVAGLHGSLGASSRLGGQLNMIVRTRTDSGKPLTDMEILEQIMVLNLDTGEQVPLSLAEERIPTCINPLSLHIMRLTSEYVSNSSLDKDKESDEESEDKKSIAPSEMSDTSGHRRRNVAKVKKFLNKAVEKTAHKIKSVKEEIHHSRHPEEFMEVDDEGHVLDPCRYIKFKASGSHKGPYEFDNFKLTQDLSGEHSGAVWTMKFSFCGRLLATAGQDHVLRIWVLRDARDYFNDMRQKYNAEAKVSPSPSQESLTSHQSLEDSDKVPHGVHDGCDENDVFVSQPFCTYTGHTADLLDVSWSKNYFILSSSMDKTVRLWHISRKECLCCFQHIDFVTAIAFHPRDDRYFISGSLDGKLRLWNIPDRKVALWNELDGQTKLITAANFCQNGKFAVVGSYDGRCIFYNTEQLKYYTQIHVRSTRGKNAKGRKITGIEPMPGEDKVLVTSNDSRIRLYDLRDLSLSCKYKGYVNLSSQIRASFSHDGRYIVSGSENQMVYIWKSQHDYSKFSSARRDRNDYWEGIKAHNAVVTSAIFAPTPSLIFKQMDRGQPEGSPSLEGGNSGYVLVTADFSGAIKVFVSRGRPKFN